MAKVELTRYECGFLLALTSSRVLSLLKLRDDWGLNQFQVDSLLRLQALADKLDTALKELRHG